jgi:hypothetical protein
MNIPNSVKKYNFDIIVGSFLAYPKMVLKGHTTSATVERKEKLKKYGKGTRTKNFLLLTRPLWTFEIHMSNNLNGMTMLKNKQKYRPSNTSKKYENELWIYTK